MTDVQAFSKTRPLYIALLAIGAVVLVGLVAVIVVLLTSGDRPPAAGSATPPAGLASQSPTPTSASTEGQQQTQQSAEPEAEFTVFAPITTEVDCTDVYNNDDDPLLEMTWDTVGAVSAWMWIDVPDVYGSYQIPVRGDTSDMLDGGRYPCGTYNDVQYVITLVGADGIHVTRSWVVTDVAHLGDED